MPNSFLGNFQASIFPSFEYGESFSHYEHDLLCQRAIFEELNRSLCDGCGDVLNMGRCKNEICRTNRMLADVTDATRDSLSNEDLQGFTVVQ